MLLAVCLLLLLASTLVRLRADPMPPLSPGQRAITLSDGSRLAWREAGPTTGLPVILLHGSPGDGSAMAPLSAALPDDWRRIAPDMLGFGGSSRDVPSYASQAHAAALDALMAAEGVESAHLVVHSMGGAVALELAASEPARVRSITMISAIGAIELELLGNHALNHAVHGAQLAAIEGALALLPHFGLLDGFPLGRSYARNFFDTDQRRLRPILSTLTVPMLIVHGETDFLVPVEAAREHHRIVPQSELVVLPTDHFLVFRPDEVLPLGERVTDFIRRVESGAALVRAEAAPERIEAAARPLAAADLPDLTGPALLVTALLIGIATFISEDLTCLSAGLLVAQGRLGFGFAALVCWAGLFFGDLLLALIGRWIGPAALRQPPLSWLLRPEAVEGAAAWYRRYGAQVIFTSRVIPGMRLPMYFAAGVLQLPLGRVTLLFALASAVWAPALVGAAALIGEPVLAALDGLRYGSLLLIGFLIASGLALRVLLPLLTWRGRRLAQARWQRLRAWEFWPMWAVYPPVLLAILLQAVRHRSLTAFTASNPGMPDGGFVGESKWDILCRLGGSAQPFIPATELLSGSERPARAAAFVAAHGYPVVLKPDVGQRGQGVAIVRSDLGLRAYLGAARGPIIIQAYVPGVEFGVFYVRLPGTATGTITSITGKRPVCVTGDGEQTLEQLILQSPEALPKAPLHLRVHAPRLMVVPAAGEEVTLVEVGTHARGSRFTDAGSLVTPALTAEIERISAGFEGGFMFGRYDIRVPSAEALSRGEGLQVIEVNGVTSEPTHIYDPRHGIGYGWRVLIAHWAMAFQIGADNIARGVAEPTSVWALLRSVRRFRAETRAGHVAVDRPLRDAQG
ncbi:MAG: pimeloyl-ACP methyl ester carboxylesterase/membrane protein DedA with SNARE-associated domain [Myxococcota bacterium]